MRHIKQKATERRHFNARKNKCKILKEIRQKIANENDIPYVTQECTFKGECKGTCPKCEAELRYLEQELAKRQRLGKAVTVAALAATLMAGLTACPSANAPSIKAAPEEPFSEQYSEATDKLGSESSETVEIAGILPIESQQSDAVKGEIETEQFEGDVAFSVDPEDMDILAGYILPSETDNDE